MVTTERAACYLFLHGMKSDAEQLADDLGSGTVRCLKTKSGRIAFVQEWLIARLSWLKVTACKIGDQAMRETFIQVANEAISVYDFAHEITVADYVVSAIAFEDGQKDDIGMDMTPGPFLLSRFLARLDQDVAAGRVTFLYEHSVDEQLQIMLTADKYCWSIRTSLEQALSLLSLEVNDELRRNLN